MAFCNGHYMKLWQIKPEMTKTGKSIYKCQASTSRKTNNGYQTDWSGWVTFIGNAVDVISTLSEKDSIKIGQCSVTNNCNKDKGITYTNYTIWECEDATKREDGNNGITTVQTDVSFVNIPDGADVELPF